MILPGFLAAFARSLCRERDERGREIKTAVFKFSFVVCVCLDGLFGQIHFTIEIENRRKRKKLSLAYT